ncbi:MAG: ABC transporter permease [Planctomycetota bacterium]
MKWTPTSVRHGRGRRLKALIGKEFRQVVRDPSSILIAFVLPLLLLFLFGYGVSLDARDISLAVAVEDGGPEAMDLGAVFQKSHFFQTRIGREAEAFKSELVAGQVRGIVVIPQDFSRALHRPADTATVQLITDASETNTATILQNYIQGVLQVWLTQQGYANARATEPAVTQVSRVFYNPELNSRNSLVPGSLAIIMAIIGTLLTALVVSREWERGTMEALLATPVGAVEIVIGKLVPYFVLGMGSILLSTAIAVGLFGVPFQGSLGALLLVSGCFLLSALGQGLLISTAAKNQFIAAQLALISAFLPAFLLSGFIFEIASMPWPIRQITRVIPARYLVTCLQTLFLAGDIWPLILPNVAVLLAIAAFFFLITGKKTSKRLG